MTRNKFITAIIAATAFAAAAATAYIFVGDDESQVRFSRIGPSPSELNPTLGYAIGSVDAPVTIIEYASLSCPHCRSFHVNVLPRLKLDYIDTGKARLLYRHFPLDPRSMAAALQVDCLPVSARPIAVEALFEAQANWSRAQEPADALFQILRQFGLTRSGFNECLTDTSASDAIQDETVVARNQHQVSGTPYFFINGEPVRGDANYDLFAEIIDSHSSQ